MRPTAIRRPATSSRPTRPFIVWNQRAAIFKAARHPATAKLLLSYLGSAEFQSSYGGWRACADVGEAPGLPPLESLKNVDVHDFTRWMADRQRVASLRRHMAQIFGPVRGESPLRDPALMSLLGLTANDIVALPEPDLPDLLNRHDGLAHGRRGVVDPGELPIRFRRQAGGLERLGRLPLLIKYF